MYQESMFLQPPANTENQSEPRHINWVWRILVPKQSTGSIAQSRVLVQLVPILPISICKYTQTGKHSAAIPVGGVCVLHAVCVSHASTGHPAAHTRAPTAKRRPAIKYWLNRRHIIIQTVSCHITHHRICAVFLHVFFFQQRLRRLPFGRMHKKR